MNERDRGRGWRTSTRRRRRVHRRRRSAPSVGSATRCARSCDASAVAQQPNQAGEHDVARRGATSPPAEPMAERAGAADRPRPAHDEQDQVQRLGAVRDEELAVALEDVVQRLGDGEGPEGRAGASPGARSGRCGLAMDGGRRRNSRYRANRSLWMLSLNAGIFACYLMFTDVSWPSGSSIRHRRPQSMIPAVPSRRALALTFGALLTLYSVSWMYLVRQESDVVVGIDTEFRPDLPVPGARRRSRPTGPAAQAGLQVGDRVRALDGRPLRPVRALPGLAPPRPRRARSSGCRSSATASIREVPVTLHGAQGSAADAAGRGLGQSRCADAAGPAGPGAVPDPVSRRHAGRAAAAARRPARVAAGADARRLHRRGRHHRVRVSRAAGDCAARCWRSRCCSACRWLA